MAAHLIAFTGERGVGKDHLTLSVKRHLESKGMTVTRLSFSDEVRRITYFAFPWLEHIRAEDKNTPLTHFEDNPNHMSWRDIVKMVGKLCRDVDPAYFIKRWVENQYPAVKEAGNDHVFIITDLRTEDEYKVMKELNVPVVKITADTGLVPDDFEQWVRDFDEANFVMHNNMDKISEGNMNEIFDLIVSVNVNETDLISLLHRQNEVNAAYTGGKEWEPTASLAKYNMAADREFSEFADEISRSWAWWKKNQVFDLNKAIVEFCDYISFSLCSFILMDAKVETVAPYQYNVASICNDFDGYYPRLKEAQAWRTNNNPDVAVEGLLEEINLTLDFLGISREDFLSAMHQVQERNIKRGQLGANYGVDTKAQETPIVTVNQ